MRTTPADLAQRVIEILERHPEGLALRELEAALTGVASRRTLQRRLAQWVQHQTIRTAGVRRGRRYFSWAGSSGSQPTPPPAGSEVLFSAAGQEVLALARRPITDREPVGYRRAFLESYLPNETTYLPRSVTSHLNAIGRTPDSERPAGTYAREMLNRLLIDLSWSSSRLEGNTYSLLDTRELIERGTPAPGKDAKETQMVLNHKAAIELLVEAAGDIGVNRYTILNLHALLADNLLDDSRNAGRLRAAPIAIGGSTYVPTAIPQLIEEMFTRLLELGAAIRDPFEQSFFLLAHISYLQPFVDVNKRTSRLASNIPLITRNLVPLSFIDVPEQLYIDGIIGIYEHNRIELLRDVYVWAYERSVRQYKTVRDSLPEPDPFRLRYRSELIEVVGELVRRKLPLTESAVHELSARLVKPDDVGRFTAIVLAEVTDLHEGNIARFRLRPSELRQWRRSG